MTFATFETSVESGRPIELYTFTVGATITRYTSAEDSINFLSNTYLPKQITRTDPTQVSDDRRATIEVTLPTEDAIAQQYISVPPGQLMSLQIIRLHRGDTDYLVIWDGNVIACTFKREGAQAVLSAVSSESALSRPIPRFKFSGLCNHMLYDGRCQVLKASFAYTGAVGAVSGNTVEVVGLEAAKGTGWALGGYVKQPDDSDFRQVRGQSGDTLTIPLPFNAPPSGTLIVQAGCDHTLATCKAKFSNVVNFGGFPYVPTKNPFTAGVRS